MIPHAWVSEKATMTQRLLFPAFTYAWLATQASAPLVLAAIWIARLQSVLEDAASYGGLVLAPNSNGPVQGEGQTLVIIVNSTAESHGLALPRTRPNGPNGIDVTFQGASFDALIAWLIVLQTNYAVEVESASFSSAREQGLVNGQLSLHRS
jgi:type II secretory pathway component PulM